MDIITRKLLLNQRFDNNLQSSQIETDSTWASENEILSTAHLLKTNTYTYTFSGNSWWRWVSFSGKFFELSIEIFNHSIYLNHTNGNYYDIVLEVSIRIPNVISNSSTKQTGVSYSNNESNIKQCTPPTKSSPKNISNLQKYFIDQSMKQF